MPETTTEHSELDELQDQQRGLVQLKQLESLEMADHIGKKLRLGRERLKKTWQDAKQLPEGEAAEASDDMGHILARNITINEAPKESAVPTPAPVTPPVTPEPKGSRWPMAAALALGLGIPATTGIVMAPRIIAAFRPTPVVTPAGKPDYVPILLPGKPTGAK